MNNIVREILQVLVLTLALNFPACAEPPEINPVIINKTGEAVFSATINKESYEKLVRLYNKNQFTRLNISSPGGDFDYGLKLAEFLYKKHIFVYVPVECSSACTIAFFGSRKNMRDMSNTAVLGLHNISIEANVQNPDKTYVSVTEMRSYIYEIADKVGYMFTLYAANNIPPTVLLEISKRRGESAVIITRTNLVDWGSLNP